MPCTSSCPPTARSASRPPTSPTRLPAEYHADLVVLLVDGKPVLAVVVEVQLAPDERKRLSWPVYEAGVRSRFACPAMVLVVTPVPGVATWARKPVPLGPSGSTFQAVVLGPDGVPVITDDAIAARAPELAVLGVLAHGQSEGAEEFALTAVRATEGLEPVRRAVYWDLIYMAVGVAAKRALEALVLSSGYQFQSEIARAAAREAARNSSQTAWSEAVLDILDARDLTPTDEQRARILACTDLEQLRHWIRRAATVATVEELFA